jgi:glycosyltransferase involved in cell wall biosynthesis
VTSNFSVVIPIRDRPKEVARLASLAKQMKNIEFILIDDCSTGVDTPKALRKLNSERIPNIKIKLLTMWKGQNYCRNLGIRMACNSIVTIIDSDDSILTTQIDQIVSLYMSFPHVPVMISPVSLMSSKNEILSHPIFNLESIGLAQFIRYGLPETQFWINKQALDNCENGNFFVELPGIIRSCTCVSWIRYLKKNRLLVSKLKCRHYNDISSDRLSYKTKSIIRIEDIKKCHDYVLRESRDLFFKYPIFVLKVFLKAKYYNLIFFLHASVQ